MKLKFDNRQQLADLLQNITGTNSLPRRLQDKKENL